MHSLVRLHSSPVPDPAPPPPSTEGDLAAIESRLQELERVVRGHEPDVFTKVKRMESVLTRLLAMLTTQNADVDNAAVKA